MKKLDPQDDEPSAADHDLEGSQREFPTGRQPGELGLDEIEVLRNRGEILAGLVGLSQC